MNERIRELAEQAKVSVPAGLLVDEWIAKYNQMFAKLIVQECISLAKICECIDGSRDVDPYTQGVNDAIHITVQRIEAMFGVEE
jgi:hypothetical protein